MKGRNGKANPIRHEPIKKVTQSLREKGPIGPLLSTFDTIDPIDLIFGTHNELPLFFQLSETTWCLMGFHGNHRYMNNVKAAAILDFITFRFY